MESNKPQLFFSGVNGALNVFIIAPSNDKDLAPFKEPRYKIVTLDIDPSSNPDVCGDITTYNSSLKDDFFDCVTCTDVIEHITIPWSAISELIRVNKKGEFCFSRLHSISEFMDPCQIILVLVNVAGGRYSSSRKF